MGAVRMLAGFELRCRWRRVVVLSLLVGVVGAVALSTVAGARRSSSALARFNTSSRAGNLELTVGSPTAAQMQAFRAVKGVASFARLNGSAITFPRAPQLQAVASAVDTRFGSVVDRARIVVGRATNPRAADEVTIGEALAAQLHLEVGDRLDGLSYSPEQVESLLSSGSNAPTVPDGPRIRVRVVGIVRRPLDLGDRGASGGVIVLTPAFDQKYENTIGSFGGSLLRVRTRQGSADAASVAAAARRIFGRSSQFGVTDLAIESQGASSAIDVLTVALWVFASVTALAGLVAIAIVLTREVSLTAVDQTTQSALGLTRQQRVAVGGLQALPVALGGALLAVVGAADASPLFPIGVARRAEPDPGLRIDWTVLALGMIVIAAGILLIALTAALRATRRSRAERTTPGLTADAIAAASRAGVTPVATIGVRMALERGRATATVPVRSAILGAVFGVLGIVAVLIFASSLDHLVVTPAQYGWTWDSAAAPDDLSVAGRHTPLLHQSGVAAVAEVVTANVQLDGHPAIAWGFTSLRGTIGPEIVAGRTPIDGDEVALGAATLDELGKNIGETVHAQGPDGSHTYRIVGRAVFPKLEQPQPLDNGAVLTGTGLDAILSPTDPNNGSPYLLWRDASGSQLAAVAHRVGAIPQIERPFGPSVPVEVDRLRQVNWLTATLAALLAVLALFAVAHALVTGVRRRRHELAVLKTLGFDRRQIRGTIAWQATTLAAAGVIIGIPVGIIIGNLVWRRVASGLGVSTAASIPTLAVVLTVVGTIAAANLIAYFPGRAAAQTRPAVALRTE
jgi:ABC-type lipoprotein release transport system permease subunit